MRKFSYFLSLISLILFADLYGATYRVGPGQDYEELGGVPWISLTAGDTVLIHWRSDPYASKIFMRAQGTKENPVVIRGVPNSNGDLPVITGENATTDSQFYGYFSAQWTEHLALFLIFRGPDDDYYTYKPKHIVFEYLALTGVKPENTFTDQFGNTRNYSDFGTAICAIVCEGLTIRHCKIYGNSQGIFTNTNGIEEGQISRDLLIEYNEIWDNGNVDDGRHHNIYSQAAGTIIQYNKIGRMTDGSFGASIKDRSSGTIIRYNWIESSARTLDLVEVEDGWQVLMQEPNYHDVYVYGNVLVNDITKNPSSANMIHFGHDNSPDLAKRGTLYFYNNTVYIKGDTDDYWYVRLFDIYDINDAQPAAIIDMYNNIIRKEGTTHLELMRDAGVLNFYANNWIQEGYTELGYGATAQINYIAQPMVGTDPGFVNEAAENFTLSNSSPVIDMAGSLPVHIMSNYPLNQEYVKHAGVRTRTAQGNAMDLGAFESGYSGNPPPSIPQNLASTAQTSSSVTLVWNASSGTVTGYKIYRDGNEIATVSDTTYTDTGLAAATSYTYNVSALNGDAESGQSDPLTATTDTAPPPSVPENLTVTGQTSTTVSLTWSPSSGNVTGYKVYRNGNEVATVTDPGYTDTGLTPETSYSYTVSALNGGVESDQSSETTATTTAVRVPTGLVVTGQTASTVSLSWNAIDEPATGYRIYRDGAEAATTSNTTYTDMGLASETTYTYTVTALIGSSESEQSAPVTATTTSGGNGGDPEFGPLNPPSNNILEVLPAPGSTVPYVTELRIRFTAPYSNEYSAGEYIKVYRSDSTLVDSIDIGSLPLVAYTSDLMIIPLSQALATNTTYYVTLNEGSIYVNQGPTWKNGAIGPGAWSFTVSDGSGSNPSVPNGLTITGRTSTTISLTWNASSGTVTGYKVYRDGNEVAVINDTTYTDTGLTPETAYTYTVSALNDNVESGQSNAVSASTDPAPAPTAPQNLISTAQTATSISLSWDASSGTVTGYKIYRNDSVISITDTTGYTDTGLNPSTSYVYSVSAVDSVAMTESPKSNSISVSTTDDTVTSLFDNVLSDTKIPYLYPNPADYIVRVEPGKLIINSFDIITLSGKIILTHNASPDKNHIDVSKLPAGIYLLRLTTDKGIKQLKLIKK